MNKRKITIGAVTLVCVLVAFGIYNLLSDTQKITFDNESLDRDGVELPDFEKGAGQIGDLKLADVGDAYFVKYDEVTKKPVRILSFESLKNPAKGTDIWRLEKPCMKILDDNYTCEIRSDRGKIRVETVLKMRDASPSMAELNGNVEIVIHTKKDDREIIVSLNDLVYDSERCEFSSEGPVKVVSDDGVMEGTGLIMIYDGQIGKLAYLEIMKLDYLTIKNVVQSDKEPTKSSVKSDQESVADSGQAGKAVKGQQAAKTNNSTVEKPEAVEDEKYKYYEARLLDNVNIEYGKRFVIVGADEVVISNILFSGEESDKQDSDKNVDTSNAVVSSVPADKVSEPVKQVSPASQVSKVETNDTEADSDDRDVYVTCKGSLIIRPMELAGVKPDYLNRGVGRRMEFTGRPVRIGQLIDKNRNDIEPIASCGAMTYDLDQEVLDLVTNGTERYVELNMSENEANIYTEGTVKWNRRDNNAVITGPGVLLVDETAKGGESSDLKFDGSMNIFFADKGAEDFSHQLSLSSVNIIGGMTAKISREGNTAVKSDRANFQFSNGKDISQVDLNGNVDLSSDRGGLKSDNARIFFAKNEAGDNVPVRMSGSGNAVLQPKQISSTRPARFHSRKIDYDMITGSAVASGPVKFIFYAPDKKGEKPTEKEKVPVIITAEDNAKYYPDENQFVFNGKVVGTKLVKHPGFVQRDTFYGEQLIVDIAPLKDDESEDDIKHVRVVGGLVEFRSKRMAGEVVVGHVGLSCMQIDWDAEMQIILAKGPGDIQINNKNAPEPDQNEKKDSDFDLSGPCVARITDFQTLSWNTLNHTIITDGGRGAVTMGYLPFKDGMRGRPVRAASRHITSHYVETDEGKFDLVSLDAKDGIIYEEVGVLKMIGDSMHYDASDGIMVIRGTDTEDCIVGNLRMPQVEYNMKTRRIISKLSSRPGTIKSR